MSEEDDVETVAIACRRGGPNDRSDQAGPEECDGMQAEVNHISGDVTRYRCTECGYSWVMDSGGQFQSRNIEDTGNI